MHTEMMPPPDEVESQVLDLANQAVGHQANGEPRQAAQHWRRAIALADAGMDEDEIRYWLRSGLAEALYQLGEDEACIDAAREARAWCAQQHTPLAALLLGQALLRCGQAEAALEALREAQWMIGARFFDVVDVEHRDAIACLMAQPRAA
ncbi:hypothetical protein [Lysobacter sp. CA199]|uniref:hypothetical protein n=1 Tax=Lysobacter sp. CA199 TaxID=3455608 RepID=UPI003F8D1DAB